MFQMLRENVYRRLTFWPTRPVIHDPRASDFSKNGHERRVSLYRAT